MRDARFKEADVALLHQHGLGGGPKTLGNTAPADVVVPPVIGGPEQGWPVNGFVPVARFRLGVTGETRVSPDWVTVFPLRIGLVVFVVGICASAIVMVAVRHRTLRPISAMRFTAICDLPIVARHR